MVNQVDKKISDAFAASVTVLSGPTDLSVSWRKRERDLTSDPNCQTLAKTFKNVFIDLLFHFLKFDLIYHFLYFAK